MDQILIKSIMNPQVKTAPPDCLLEDALEIMTANKISSVVVTVANKPVGILTDDDTVALLAKFLRNIPAEKIFLSDVMVKPPITIYEESPISEAFDLKRQYKVHHIAVVDNCGNLSGIITHIDLLLAHSQIVESQRRFMAKAVSDQTKELQEMNQHMQLLSARDAMLDIGNRRAMELDLRQMHATALRYGRPYSVALIDVDYFKDYVDHYGPNSTDNLLKRITISITKAIRLSDQLYRYGEKELLLILRETEIEGATVITSRIIEAIENMDIPHEKSELEVVTLSAGIADNFIGGICSGEWQDVIARAEEALAVAQRNGRNQHATPTASFAEEISANLQKNIEQYNANQPKH